MPLDEFTKESAKRQLNEFCEKRVPLHAREQVNLTYSFWRDSIILYEVRKVPTPSCENPSTVEYKIARIDFNEKPIKEIDEDPTGIFGG